MSASNSASAQPATQTLDESSVQSCGKIVVISKKFSHIWTIENFSLCDKQNGESIESSVFTTGADDRIQWNLSAFPNGVNKGYKDFFGLFLTLNSSEFPEISAKFKFSVIKGNKEMTNTFTPGEGWGISSYLKKTELLDTSNGLLVDDKLTLYCEGEVTTDSVSLSGIGNPIKVLDDLNRLLGNKKFSDISIEVNGKEFFAHKCILSMRSPVFEVMFDNNMSENKTNKVIITDMEEQVVKEMLRFIYTGRVENLKQLSAKLLSAADKYEIKDLKLMSEQSICETISVETAAEVLILADLHTSGQRVKAFAINFCNENAVNVRKTNGWKKMVRKYPKLIDECYERMAKQVSTLLTTISNQNSELTAATAAVNSRNKRKKSS